MSISVPQDGMTDLIEINEFPTELKLALKGLDNENRQKILLALLSHVKLSFADIQKTANVKKTLVPNHLDVLIKNLLIEHFYEHQLGEKKYSYYQLSQYGKSLLGHLLGSLKMTVVTKFDFKIEGTIEQTATFSEGTFKLSPVMTITGSDQNE